MRALWIMTVALSLCLALSICSAVAEREVSEKLIGQIDTSSWLDYTIDISPDGEHIAYSAKMDSKYYVVLDGEKGKQYDHTSYITFSPDSKRLAYVAQEGKEEFVVVDGKEGKRYSSHFAFMPDNIEDLTFSPDSKKVAYKAYDSGKEFVILDSTEGKKYDFMGDLTFSPDNKSLTYRAREKDKHFIVFNNKEEELPYAINSLLISPDGKRRAYFLDRDNKAFLVLEGVEGKHYDKISRATFSPDSKHFAYNAYSSRILVTVTPVYGPGGENLTYIPPPRYKERYVVVDGKEGQDYGGGIDDFIGPDGIVFSPNSKRVAYRAEKEGKQLVVVDGREGKLYPKVGLPYFSPDSKKVAYNAILSKSYKDQVMVLNGVAGELYDFIGDPVFSPDSKIVAYSAIKNGKYFVVVDQEEGKRYDDILSLKFDSPEKIHYLALNEDKLYRVEEKLVQAGPTDQLGAGDLLFSDDFDARKESGWTTHADRNYTQYYRDGKYNIEIFRPDFWIRPIAPKKLMLEDFVIEVDVAQEGGPKDNAFGIVIRYADRGNYSGFAVSGDGFYGHWQRVNGESDPFLKWARSGAIKTGRNQSNTLKIVSHKDHSAFYVNGEKVAEYSDSNPVAGNIGLWAESYSEGGIHITFDNLKVWALKE